MGKNVIDENSAKLKSAREHFAKLNELQKEQKYYFKFIHPYRYDHFLKALAQRNYKIFKSEFKAQLEK